MREINIHQENTFLEFIPLKLFPTVVINVDFSSVMDTVSDASDVFLNWSIVAEVVFNVVAPLVFFIVEECEVDVTVVILIETSNVEVFVKS